MIGDLKFLSMMLGKENFETYWCILCQLAKKDWQDAWYDATELLWTLEKLKEQAELSKNLKGTARKGVREAPYFDIPV